MRERPPTDHSPNYALALTQLRLVSQVSFGGATNGKWLAPPPSAGQEPQILPALPIIQTYPDRSAAVSPSKCKMPRFGRGRSCNVMMLGYAWAGSVLANLPVEESSYWRSRCQTWQLNFTAYCATKIGGCIMPLLMHTLHALSRKQRGYPLPARPVAPWSLGRLSTLLPSSKWVWRAHISHMVLELAGTSTTKSRWWGW